MYKDAFNQNAHAVFKQLRQDAPVCEARMTRTQSVYLISRYEDVAAALKDPRIIKNPRTAKETSGTNQMWWMPPAFRPLLHNMLNTDEPDHRRLRNLVHKAFTPRMIAQLEPRIEQIALDLITKAKQQGEFDLVQAYALPLPITVISEMLGVPEEDRPKLFKWIAQFLSNPTPLHMIKAIPAIRRTIKYLQKLAMERRDAPQDDLITSLAQAREGNDQFSDDELVGMMFLLILAGHETTVSLIANGTRALLQNRDEMERLRHDESLLPTAIEEMLRYDGPLQTTEISFAREDIQLHGVTIPAGHAILSALLSANRDETMFETPNRFDVSRTPNKHLAFGHGIHYCLGAPLARLEGIIAFRTLLEHCPELRLAVPDDQIRYVNLMMLNKLKALPVRTNNK